jgi:hypothetical protein
MPSVRAPGPWMKGCASGQQKEKDAMRMKMTAVVAGVVVALAATGASLFAHHAFSAEFDAKKPVKFTGTVTKMEWTNPHVWLHMDVKTPDGKVESWAFEAGTPNNLFRRGFTRQALLPGTVVVVEGYQAKDGTRRANGRDLTLPDGRTLFMGSSGTGAPYELVPDHIKKATGQEKK